MVKPTSVKDVDQHEIVRQIAGFLKKSGKVRVPDWSDVVKLSQNKELAPTDGDWYYIRTASVARRLYIRSPAGKSFMSYFSSLFMWRSSNCCLFHVRFYVTVRNGIILNICFGNEDLLKIISSLFSFQNYGFIPIAFNFISDFRVLFQKNE